MIRHIFILTFLAVIWCFLSGHYTGLLLSLGVFSCAASYFLYQKINQRIDYHPIVFNPFRQLRYLAWLVVQIIKSNIDVIRVILNPARLSPRFFTVSADGLDETAKVIYANSITLTPGTVSTEIGENEITVHALLESSVEDLKRGQMQEKVKQLCPAGRQ